MFSMVCCRKKNVGTCVVTVPLNQWKKVTVSSVLVSFSDILITRIFGVTKQQKSEYD